MLTAFGIFIHLSKISHTVIDVITPSKIVADINKNNIADNNEVFCAEGIESFSLNPSDKFSEKYTKLLNISDEDIINLGYLGNEFARKNLMDRKIGLKPTEKVSS